MGLLHHTTATLRFFGDDLDPDEITARLGLVPTVGARKGGVWIAPSGKEMTARTGVWRLKATPQEPGNLDTQIEELLGPGTPDLSAWRDLSSRFRADIFCGLFLKTGNDGVSLEPQTLAAVGERGLLLDFDIYGAIEDD